MPSGLGARRSFTRSLGQSRALRLHFGTSTRPFGVATRSPGAATRSVDGTSVTLRDQHSVTPYGTSRVRCIAIPGAYGTVPCKIRDKP